MRANSLQVKLDRFANMCVLTAKGEIDLTNHHLLGQTLDQLDDRVALLLDLSRRSASRQLGTPCLGAHL
jgi:hypothetical protein